MQIWKLAIVRWALQRGVEVRHRGCWLFDTNSLIIWIGLNEFALEMHTKMEWMVLCKLLKDRLWLCNLGQRKIKYEMPFLPELFWYLTSSPYSALRGWREQRFGLEPYSWRSCCGVLCAPPWLLLRRLICISKGGPSPHSTFPGQRSGGLRCIPS